MSRISLTSHSIWFALLSVLVCVVLLMGPSWTSIAWSAQADGEAAGRGQAAGPFMEGDRILFLGDDVTQQMFFDRAIATALLTLYPDQNLRFFNGGKDGATPASCGEWLDDLLGMTRPTVVFVLFGFNAQTDEAGEAAYRESLDALAKDLKVTPGVRHVILLGPPPMQDGLAPGEPGNDSQVNQSLARLNTITADIARAQGLGFIELYSPMRVVYLEGLRVGGEPLSLNGRHPSEPAHAVLASVILHGLGVDRAGLERAGWAPLMPLDMARVRPALAIPTDPPSVPEAERSRRIYLSLLNYQQAFFRAWRLGGRQRTSPTRSREVMMGDAQSLWAQIVVMIEEELSEEADQSAQVR